MDEQEREQESIALHDPAIRLVNFVAGLRELADWYEAHPEIPLPYYGGIEPLPIYGLSPLGDELTALVRIGKAMGHCEKKEEGYFFKIQRRFGPVLTLEAVAYREKICEKIQVEKIVKKQVPVRYAKKEEIVPVEWREQEMVEKVEEWKCPGSLMELAAKREREAMADGEVGDAHPAA